MLSGLTFGNAVMCMKPMYIMPRNQTENSRQVSLAATREHFEGGYRGGHGLDVIRRRETTSKLKYDQRLAGIEKARRGRKV